MTKEIIVFDTSAEPEGEMLCHSLTRVLDGYMMAVSWPYGGNRPMGSRTCESMAEVLGVLRNVCAKTVDESRNAFTWDKEAWAKTEARIEPGTDILSSLHRLEETGFLATIPGAATVYPRRQPLLSFQELVDFLLDWP